MAFYNAFLPIWADYLFSLGTVLVPSYLILLALFQRYLIYIPNFPPDSRVTHLSPDRYGFEDGWEEWWLRTKDGVKVHAFWLPSSRNADEHVTILYFHANAGNASHRLPMARILQESIERLSPSIACNFVLLSYRGYGKSEGSPSEQGIILDSQACMDQILKHQADLRHHKIFVYGQSLGGAVAVALAHAYPQHIYGIIVENTFWSMCDLIPDILPILRPFRSIVYYLCTERWESGKKMSEVVSSLNPRLNVLILAGEEDEMIPSERNSMRLWIETTSLDRLQQHKKSVDKVSFRIGDSQSEPTEHYHTTRLKLLVNYHDNDEHEPCELNPLLENATDDHQNDASFTVIRQFTVFKKGKHNDTCIQRGYNQVFAQFIIDVL